MPETITREDLLDFDMLAEFKILREHAPLLYHVVAGAMGLEGDQLEVELVNLQHIIEFTL